MQHRVLYIARAPFVSGAERALESMLRHLNRDQVQAGVILGHDTALSESIQAMRLPVWFVPLAQRTWINGWGWRKSVGALQRVMREFRPTLLHANDVPSAQGMSVLGARLEVPRVVHVRWGISAVDMNWWVPRGCDEVLCISGWVREQLGSVAGTKLADAQITVLPDAVDWPALPDASPKDWKPRDPARPVKIGFAGQLIPEKGLDLVIAAMAKLPTAQRPLLLVAGRDTQSQGRYQAELQSLAERLHVSENIQWLGFLSNVQGLYEQVQAMVCPSRVEPLGLIPLEAARYALPTVAHDTGGFRETIRHGETGWLVPVENIDAWAQTLMQLHNHALVLRCGLAARDHTQTHFAPMIYQHRLLNVYDRLRKR